MVQVLPYVPSFGERITPILNDALAKVGEGFRLRGERKRDETILQSLKSGDLSDIQLNDAYSRLSPKAQKNFEPFLNSQLRVKEAEQKQAIKSKSEEAKSEREKEAVRQELIPASKALSGLIDSAAYGAGGQGKSAELDASGFWYTDKVYTHFNKGVVSNVRFENMKNELAPNSSNPPSVNRARLASLNRMANLPADISSEKFDAILDKEIKSVQKVEAKEDKVTEKKGASSGVPAQDLAEIWGS